MAKKIKGKPAAKQPKSNKTKLSKGIKVKLPIFLVDNGDGSAGVMIFRNMKEAERAARHEENSGYGHLTDTTMEMKITVDTKGNIIDGFDDIEEFCFDDTESDILPGDTCP
jgi:hypothetical protein